MSSAGDRPELDRTKLLAARFRAAHDRPYLASALYALTVVPSTLTPTMAVDRRWRCYANPRFVAETPVEQLAGVWLHEVSHVLRDHHGRAGRLPAADQHDHHRINLAQDCEINDDLVADGVTLPPERIEPATFGLRTGQLFEQYLPNIPPTPPALRWQCGSGAHGVAEPWDLDAATGVSPVEADAIRRLTAEAVRNHARSRGTVPGGLLRWAEAILEPVVDWRTVLAGSVRQAVAQASGAVDYTYQRPSRRSAANPRVVLPSLRRPVPNVAIVVDTSGSMSDEYLGAAVSEVAGVLDGVGVRRRQLTVVACDAAVAATSRVANANDIELAGGGGTDMRVGIAAALELADRPDIVVVLTDGFTPWPEDPVPARVIAGLIGAGPPEPPPWVEAVRIPV